MRKQLRGVFAALVITGLYVTSASAAPSPSMTGRAKELIARLKVIIFSRLGPPIGQPAPEDPEPTTTTSKKSE